MKKDIIEEYETTTCYEALEEHGADVERMKDICCNIIKMLEELPLGIVIVQLTTIISFFADTLKNKPAHCFIDTLLINLKLYKEQLEPLSDKECTE